MNKIPDHFNEAANTWDSEETIQRTSVFAASIKKHLVHRKINALMDFGCGTGLLAEHFLDSTSYILGIDTSAGMLEKFDLRFKNKTHSKSLFINLEAEEIPDDEPLFDIIVSSMAFHHLNEPMNTLHILKQQLLPDGQVFIIDLDEEDGSFHPDNKAMGVKHFGFSKEEMSTWAQELGFKSFSHEIVYQIKKNNRSYGLGMGIFHNQ